MKLFSVILATLAFLVPSANAQGIRLIINNGNQADTTHLIFNAGSSVGYDAATDLAANPQTGNGRNYILTDAAASPLHVNYVPLPDYSYTVPVSVFVQTPGNTDFLLEAESSFPPGTRFVLEVLWTGPAFELIPGVPVQQYLVANDINDPPAYVLHVFPAPVITTTAVSCNETSDGTLHVSFGNSEQWIMNVYDSAPTLLYSFYVSGHDTTLTGLPSDHYLVSIGGPVYYSDSAIVNAPAMVDATFTLVADSIFTGQPVQLVNNANPNNLCSWDFGDSSAPLTGAQPWYTYTTPGSYIITQTVTTSAGCTASFGHKVDVLQGITTSISETAAAEPFLFMTQNDGMTIHPQKNNGPFEVAVYTLDGKLVSTASSDGSDISVSVPANGIYLLRTQTVKTGTSFAKTIYINGR